MVPRLVAPPALKYWLTTSGAKMTPSGAGLSSEKLLLMLLWLVGSATGGGERLALEDSTEAV